MHKTWQDKIAMAKEVHMDFTDIEKEYDRIPYSKLRQASITLNINWHLLPIIRELYERHIELGKN